VEKIFVTGIERKVGKTVYVVEYNWFLKWKNYVEEKYNGVITIKDDN
jgi:hypothetical protein